MEEKIDLIKNLMAIGFKLKEAYQFVDKHKLVSEKSWVVYEEPGIALINEYSLSKITLI